MKRFLLPLLLFLLFVSESIFVDLLPSDSIGAERIFVPRFMMVALIMITTYYHWQHALYYGIGFGLLFDVIYTDIIGIYMFSFALIVYLISIIMKVLHENLFVMFFVSIIGIALLELLVYGIYLLIGEIQMAWSTFLMNRLFPTVVLNGGFLILIFYPFKRLLVYLANSQQLKSH